MPTISLYDDEELLAKIGQGDSDAFKVIYDGYRKMVYSSALRLLRSEEQAEEVLQEVFMKLWLLRKDLVKVRHLESYLSTLVRNRCLNVLRRSALELKAEGELSLDWAEEHNETEERIILNEYHRILNQGLEQLPPKQREVYLLCYRQGLKYEQAARQLEISPLTVKTHMQAALRSLRKYVRNHADFAIFLIILKNL